MTSEPPASAATSFEVGDLLLDRYKVTGFLGAGGMSRVYSADDRWMGRPVALRVPARRPTAEQLAHFEREARIMLRLSGAYFAAVYDLVSTADGIPIMVMEHLLGEDLSAHLRKRGPLPRREAIDLILQACEAVAQAHALGVVHLDLKPSNLFLASTPGGAPLFKVLDFGISRNLFEGPVPERSGGTPLYAPPEQLEAAITADPRADVWSLGVVLYEMLTGARPFAGATTEQARRAVATGSYRLVSTYSDEIPPALERALAGALAVEPWMRVPSVESFAETLWPFGTSDAMASSDRVRRIAERPREAPAETPRDPTPLFRKTSLTPSHEVSPRPLRRWRRLASAALAFGLGAASFLGVKPLLRLPDVSVGPQISLTPEQECEFGVGEVCAKLAAREAFGDDSPDHNLYVLAHYRRACTFGYRPGCLAYERMLMFGTCVGLGISLKKETDAVMIAYELCEHGEAQGCVDVSRAYEYGRGLPMNAESSFAYAERACGAGSLDGCARMARSRLDGDGVEPDGERGRAELRTACDLGGFAACEEMAALDATGLPTHSEQAPWPAAPECPEPRPWDQIAKNIGQ